MELKIIIITFFHTVCFFNWISSNMVVHHQSIWPPSESIFYNIFAVLSHVEIWSNGILDFITISLRKQFNFGDINSSTPITTETVVALISHILTTSISVFLKLANFFHLDIILNVNSHIGNSHVIFVFLCFLWERQWCLVCWPQGWCLFESWNHYEILIWSFSITYSLWRYYFSPSWVWR